MLASARAVVAAVAAVALLACGVGAFTQEPWLELAEHSGFGARTTSSAVVFQDKAVIAGGEAADSLLNDVWQTDGLTGKWTRVTAAAAWQKRMGHSLTVVGDSLWLTGGYAGFLETKQDVWTTTDLVNWVNATNTAAWSPRSGHMTVYWKEKVWLMGGARGSTYNAEVWTASDPGSWTRVTSPALWAARTEASAVVFNDTLYVAGGRGSGSALTVGATRGYFNDVWSTVDGSTWVVADRPAPWYPRSLFRFVVYGSAVWVAGGVFEADANTATTLGDVWKSSDGTSTWEVVTGDAVWSNRSAFALLPLDDQLLLFGGRQAHSGGDGITFSFLDDSWQSTQSLPCEYQGQVCAKHGICGVKGCGCWSGWAGKDCLIPQCNPGYCMHGHCQAGPEISLQAALGTPSRGACAQLQLGEAGAVEAVSKAAARLPALQQCLANLPPARVIQQLTATPSHCACDPLWSNQNCSAAICKAGCNHGTCVNRPDACDCVDGYFGPLCDQHNQLHILGTWVDVHLQWLSVGLGGAATLFVVVSSILANHVWRSTAAVKRARARSTGRRVRFA